MIVAKFPIRTFPKKGGPKSSEKNYSFVDSAKPREKNFF